MGKNRGTGGSFVIEKGDTIKAVYKSELDSFLESIKMLEDFKSGNIKCMYCGKPVTEVNLLAFVPYDGSYKVCCTDAACNVCFMQEASGVVN